MERSHFVVPLGTQTLFSRRDPQLKLRAIINRTIRRYSKMDFENAPQSF
jgi:hypothetical protein